MAVIQAVQIECVCNVAQLGFGNGYLGLVTAAHDVRRHDGHQQAQDDHNHHDFNQGEAPAACNVGVVDVFHSFTHVRPVFSLFYFCAVGLSAHQVTHVQNQIGRASCRERV